MKRICGDKEQISAFLDGALPESEAAAVKAHLDDCPECRKEMAAYGKLTDLLRGMPAVEPSDGFNREFWRKIEAENTRQSRWRIFRPGTWGWRPAAAFAAVLLVVGGITVYRAMPPARVIVVSDAGVAETMDAAGMAIAADLDFYQDMDIVSRLDFLENWDAVSMMEEI
jgi:anti-sigma factor RsiW